MVKLAVIMVVLFVASAPVAWLLSRKRLASGRPLLKSTSGKLRWALFTDVSVPLLAWALFSKLFGLFAPDKALGYVVMILAAAALVNIASNVRKTWREA